MTNWLENYHINYQALRECLERQEIGAVEFATIHKAGESTKLVLELLGSVHGGMGAKRYVEELLRYLFRQQILVEKKGEIAVTVKGN